MKKYLILFTILTMVLALNARVVWAEDESDDSATSPTTATNGTAVTNNLKEQRDEIKNQLEKEKEDAKGKIETAREEAKTKMVALKESIKVEKDALKAKLKEEIIFGRQQALDRFDNAVERISTQKDKVNAMIEKMAGKGVDVTGAKALMSTLDTTLQSIEVKITTANTLLSSSLNQLTAEQKTNLRNLTKEIQALVNSAHQTLIDATRALKDAVKLKTENKTAKPTETENN